MRKRPILVAILFLAAAQVGHTGENWPHWRGPSANGVSDETDLPLRWSTEENVHWKLDLPGRSGATPIIWGDHVFVNVSDGDSIELWNVDRRNGDVRWKKVLGGGNRRIRKHNHATPSPVTDGESVWVMTGTGLLRRLDFEGNEIWMRDIQADYFEFGLNWGYGSSPLLYGDSLYVQVLHGMKTDDPSFLLRIDKETGETRWYVERPTEARRESPDSYTTPAVVETAGGLELVITGGDCVTGHDLETGRELWRANGLNPRDNANYRIVASPLVMGDVVVAPTRERPMLVLRAGGRGDVTESALLWSSNNGPDVPTPVSDGTYLYVVRDNGVLYVHDPMTGEQVYGGKRLRPGTYSSSPVIADGRVYFTNEDGVTTVIRQGPEFEILAENSIDDYTLASPAMVGGQIFLRSDFALWAIGPPGNKGTGNKGTVH